MKKTTVLFSVVMLAVFYILAVPVKVEPADCSCSYGEWSCVSYNNEGKMWLVRNDCSSAEGGCTREEINLAEAIEYVRKYRWIDVNASMKRTGHALCEAELKLLGTGAEALVMIYLPEGCDAENCDKGYLHTWHEMCDVYLREEYPIDHPRFQALLMALVGGATFDGREILITTKSYAAHQVLEVVNKNPYVFHVSIAPAFGAFIDTYGDKVNPHVATYVNNLREAACTECILTSFNDCWSLFTRGSALTKPDDVHFRCDDSFNPEHPDRHPKTTLCPPGQDECYLYGNSDVHEAIYHNSTHVKTVEVPGAGHMTDSYCAHGWISAMRRCPGLFGRRGNVIDAILHGRPIPDEPTVNPDRFEPNNNSTQATTVEPGTWSATIGARNDRDFFEVDLLLNNRIRATVEYDPNDIRNINSTSKGDLLVYIYPYPDHPIEEGVPLPSIAGTKTSREVIDGKTRLYIEWENKSNAKPHLVVVTAKQPGYIGPYTLTIQTRGHYIPTPDSFDVTPVLNTVSLNLPTVSENPSIKRGVIEGNIHTGGGWRDPKWETYFANPDANFFAVQDPKRLNYTYNPDIDWFSVNVPDNNTLTLNLASTNPNAGQIYVKVLSDSDPNTTIKCQDDDSNWPSSHTITVKVRSRCLSSKNVIFMVSGKYNRGFRSDTGGYTLTVELTAPTLTLADSMVIAPPWWIGATTDPCSSEGGKTEGGNIGDLLSAGLAQYFYDDPHELGIMLSEPGAVNYIVKPPKPDDPYILKTMSQDTGQVIHSISLSTQYWSSPEEVEKIIPFLNPNPFAEETPTDLLQLPPDQLMMKPQEPSSAKVSADFTNLLRDDSEMIVLQEFLADRQFKALTKTRWEYINTINAN